MRASILAAVVLASLTAPAAAGTPADTPPGGQTADTYYWRAVDSADPDRRAALLQSALAVDPDHAPSRAELGQMETDGGWLPADEAIQIASENPQKAEYLERRADLDGSPRGAARLARWCQRAGLKAEARPHWLAVLQANPNHRGALDALGVVRRGGQLVDREVAEAADERRLETASSAKQWERRLTRLERQSLDEGDLESIVEEVDRGAAEPVERRIDALDRGDPALAAKRLRLSTAFVEGSYNDTSPEMTESLSRIAVFAPVESLRGGAAESLETRERFDVVPALMAHFVSPIDSEHQVSRDRNGNIVYQHRLVAEGEQVDQVLVRQRVARVTPPSPADVRTPGDLAMATALVTGEMLRRELGFHVEALQTESQVEAWNNKAQRVNQRVATVLANVTDESLGDNPREWWDHWQRYSGYDVPYERPVQRTYETSDRVYSPYYEPPRRCECFVAGTPVWTREGRVVIEAVRPGDLVLSRDPHRGALVFRVVTDTTTREPSPVVEVRLGDDTIRATEGHPFWVVGAGWRMARQLAEGDTVSTVEGPREVESVKSIGQRPAHNLVVEGSANYYVGDLGVLVHDNTARLPAVGLVAGR